MGACAIAPSFLWTLRGNVYSFALVGRQSSDCPDPTWQCQTGGGFRLISFRAVVIAVWLFFGLTSDSLAFSANWPQFRGSQGAGISEEAQGLPAEFGPNTNLAWKMAIPAGCSSPVVSGDRVWLAGYEGSRRLIWCLHLASGRRLWEQTSSVNLLGVA